MEGERERRESNGEGGVDPKILFILVNHPSQFVSRSRVNMALGSVLDDNPRVETIQQFI